ncbi:MAG: hypothetical protein B9S32_09290 [Verrucomicrobia bacterium Tous-C9LFEB]|nr:MAG: hypothetical protein B9S32_09290 [Verrucomicrobia bacterium Tous-C9LFEB]
MFSIVRKSLFYATMDYAERRIMLHRLMIHSKKKDNIRHKTRRFTQDFHIGYGYRQERFTVFAEEGQGGTRDPFFTTCKVSKQKRVPIAQLNSSPTNGGNQDAHTSFEEGIGFQRT